MFKRFFKTSVLPLLFSHPEILFILWMAWFSVVTIGNFILLIFSKFRSLRRFAHSYRYSDVTVFFSFQKTPTFQGHIILFFRGTLFEGIHNQKILYAAVLKCAVFKHIRGEWFTRRGGGGGCWINVYIDNCKWWLILEMKGDMKFISWCFL